MNIVKIKQSVVALLLLFPGLIFSQGKAQQKKPNIIYIYADDLGYTEIGYLLGIPRKGWAAGNKDGGLEGAKSKSSQELK